ncbi:DNA-3-methyladenine glycosylase I [Nitrincola sp. MINF-07-Sa-05]|uniref:DNA-3-methyladenine glycosylase I n=1 Tax=Nitrincola salilacus TaxID=3400273 RepID=UPI003917D854
MSVFDDIHERALARKGGAAALRALLPQVAKLQTLREIPDDRYLSVLTQYIFKAGFVWRVIDNKWPGFEAAFQGFVPLYWQQVSPEVLEALSRDERIVRNMQKIRTVPENARMIVEASQQHEGFGHFLAQWPSSDQAGLLKWLQKHGSRLGGATPQYFLRSMGWDGFVLSRDVAAVLKRERLMDAAPSSQKGLKQAQEAFNRWHEETGLPYSHLSRILACSVDD